MHMHYTLLPKPPYYSQHYSRFTSIPIILKIVADPGDKPAGCVLQQLVDRHNLYIVSLSSISESPEYTFWKSQTRISVDNIIGCLQASHFIATLLFYTQTPTLNTCDYLPISIYCFVERHRPYHSLQDLKID